eukprot:s2027_g5.t1
MQTVLQRFPTIDIRLLSLDTAVDESLNIHSHALWQFLIHAARSGRVLCMLQGPPCETWTAARHQVQVDDHGMPIRGPRPLRSAEDLWGLASLTCGELAQLYTGNVLLLKGVLLACVITLAGGATILEHPATPFMEEYASIWRLGLMRMLMRHPHGPFRRVSIEQWRYGSPGVKPTTLMFSNVRLAETLEKFCDPQAVRPQQHLIGKNSDGTYKTSQAKEYPPYLNIAFAEAFSTVLSRWSLDRRVTGDEPYGAELARLGACAKRGEILPDYQPEILLRNYDDVDQIVSLHCDDLWLFFKDNNVYDEADQWAFTHAIQGRHAFTS